MHLVFLAGRKRLFFFFFGEMYAVDLVGHSFEMGISSPKPFNGYDTHSRVSHPQRGNHMRMKEHCSPVCLHGIEFLAILRNVFLKVVKN